MRTDDELKALAKDYVFGQVWTNYDFPERDLHRHFMVLALMPPRDFRALHRRRPRMIYEYARNASRMGLNGKPIFFSLYYLQAREYKRFRSYVTAVQDALDRV